MSELVYVKKATGNTWLVGMPTVTIEGVTDMKALKSFDVTKTTDATHMKDADGITRASVYADVSASGSATLVHDATTVPKVKDSITYNGETYVITSVGESYSADAKFAMTNVSFESFEGWATASE